MLALPRPHDLIPRCMERPAIRSESSHHVHPQGLHQRMFTALRNADVAGLLRDSDLRQFANAVVTVQRGVDVLQFPSEKCPGCSKDSLKPRPEKSTHAVVLDTDGMHTRSHTPVRCREVACRNKGKYLWSTFLSESKGDHVMFADNLEGLDIIMTSVTFGVTRKWYDQFSQRLNKHFASFSGEAEVHHHASSSSSGLSMRALRRNLQDAWFKITLFRRHREIGKVGDFRLDLGVPDLIQAMWLEYEPHMRRRRVFQARARSSQITHLVIDGHAKLTRRTCAELLACQIMGVPALNLLGIIPCPDTPAKSSCFCEKHAGTAGRRSWGDRDEYHIRSVRVKAPLGKMLGDIIDVAVPAAGRRNKYVDIAAVPRDAFSKFVHDASLASLRQYQSRRSGDSNSAALLTTGIDDALTLAELAALRCETHKMGRAATKAKRGRVLTVPDAEQERPLDTPLEPARNRARRTGGFLVGCTSDGTVVDIVEFYGAESLSQRYLFVSRLREAFPELRVIIHDDACHLRRFADKRKDINDFARSLAHPAIRYIIDKFHARGHVDPWCLEHCHPKAQEVQGLLDGVKTSICEVTFAKFSRWKHMFRKMGRWTGLFFMSEMVDLNNDAGSNIADNVDAICDAGDSDSSNSSSDSSSSSSSESSAGSSAL